MATEESLLRAKLRKEILRYLLQHPEAQDTVEGIAQWWLLERRIERHTRRLRAVVEELTAEGLLVERTGLDQRSLYRLNRRRIADIEELLGERG